MLRFPEDRRSRPSSVGPIVLPGPRSWIAVAEARLPRADRLESGAEGSVHVDAVLEYNQDPSYLADLALYRLTVQARERFEESPLSARQVAAMLGTSPSQLYRLLDPTNYNKSLRQLIALLYYIGYDIDVEISERRPRAAS